MLDLTRESLKTIFCQLPPETLSEPSLYVWEVPMTYWKPLEHWTHTMFLAAGVLFVGHAAVRAVEAFTSVPPPVDVFGPTGYVAAILGLFGLYPVLVESTPTTTRVAAGIASIVAPAWVVISGWSFGEAAGLLPPQTAIVPEAFFIGVILSTLLMYLLFGIASLRAQTFTRTFSLLILSPVALFLLLIVFGVVLAVNGRAGAVLIGGGLAIVHGAIGGMLLTGSTQTDRLEPAGDMSVE